MDLNLLIATWYKNAESLPRYAKKWLDVSTNKVSYLRH